MTTQNNNTPKPRLRPTLVVGLGGTGHRIVLWLKSLVWQSWGQVPDDQAVKFLVFDTAQEDLKVSLPGREISLEPGSEFHDIGQTPVANIKRNLSQQSAIEERLGSVMAGLPPAVLRNGAKQLRPLGLLALLWRFPDVESYLRDAIWSLAGRQHSDSREGINVFIANSLVGGTGSSAFLDVAHVVRGLFDELGTLADFCYITGVGVLPRAFHGINGPNLIPNAVASLKELNHCMMRGGFNARYPNGRLITTMQPPFNIYYLIDGVDERGHTWGSANEVCRLAAEAIFLQMGSQVGQKHENDFDNLDEVLVRQTEDGHGTFYGSFGLASLYFPGPEAARICAARQAGRVLQQGLLRSPAEAEAINTAVTAIWAALEVEPNRLLEQLSLDEEGLPLTVELGLPGWANRLAPTALPAELIRYVQDYEQARLGVDFRRGLIHNEKRLLARLTTTFQQRLTELTTQLGLPGTEAVLAGLARRVSAIAGPLNRDQLERESRQTALTQELGHLELAFLQAGESGFFGRGRRVARAQHAYLSQAQQLFQIRWDSQVTASMLTLLTHLDRLIQDGLHRCQATTTRLQAVLRTIQPLAAAEAPAVALAGVTTRSLISPALLDRLFSQYAVPVSDTMAALFSRERAPLDWAAATPEAIETALLAACTPAFAAVAAMTIEQALQLEADQLSAESYYTWLSTQATPSWNLDRTRLPEGGAALQRVEVLGVPDEQTAGYQRRATALVSTGDPARITAFVAHIGAAHTAIQQWDSYHLAYEQARGHVPLHVLPQFQADNEKARQTFALASLFRFIETQGAYFYYIPADSLTQRVKLAQGLANSLNAFIKQAGLVQETRDRVEQRVAQQGLETTLRQLQHYYDGDNGRYPADDLILELKRLVRAYAGELRQIYQFAGPANRDKDQTGDLTT